MSSGPSCCQALTVPVCSRGTRLQPGYARESPPPRRYRLQHPCPSPDAVGSSTNETDNAVSERRRDHSFGGQKTICLHLFTTPPVGYMHDPAHADHRIRWMPSTRSEPCRPVGPIDGIQFSPDAGIGGRLGSDSVDGMLRILDLGSHQDGTDSRQVAAARLVCFAFHQVDWGPSG